MGEIVNLRRARKRRASEAAEREAAANRAAFGVPKSARETAEALRRLEQDRLDAHKRSEPGDGG
jgi:hypothetical protein